MKLRVFRLGGLDLLALCGVVAVCGILGWVCLFKTTGPDWYRAMTTTTSRDFGPSVMVALGKGFVSPKSGEIPAIDGFLNQEQNSLVEVSPLSVEPPNPWADRHRYLLTTIGLLWRAFGISWDVVKWFLLFVFCVLAGCSYGLMRLGMTPVVAAGATLLFLCNPGVLGMLPSVRDFCKAPFIIASIFCMGVLVKRPLAHRSLWGIALLLGLIQGVGMGFRHDVFVCTAASVCVLLFCGIPDGRKWAVRAVAVALLLGTFLAVSWPIRSAYRGTGAPMHDICVGLATSSEDALRMSRASYERFYVNHDNFVYSTQCSFARRALGFTEPFNYDCKRAEHVGRRFLWENLKTFPADMLTRGLAAVLWAVRGAREPFVNRWDWEKRWENVIVLVAALGFGIIAARNMRRAWLVLFLLFFFGGYACLQFQYRHAFHLRFAGVWMAGFVLDTGLRAVFGIFRRAGRDRAWSFLRSPKEWRAPLGRAFLFLGLAVALTAGPLWAARLYQDGVVARLLSQYSGAELAPVETEQVPLGDWVLFRPVHRDALCACISTGLDWPFQDSYWAVEFSAGSEERSCWACYEIQGQASAPLDISAEFMIAATPNTAAGTTRLFLPIHEGRDCANRTRWSRFAGIGVPRERASELKALYLVRNSDEFRLWPVVTIPADPAQLRLHQTLNVPERTPYPQVASFWEPYRNARHLAGLGERDKALRTYKEALALDPGSLELAMGCGNLLEQGNEWAAAADVYGQAMSSVSDSPTAFGALDAAYLVQNNAAGRVEEWRAQLQRLPESVWASLHLGLALEAIQDMTGAIDAYSRAMRLFPGEVSVGKHLMEALERQDRVEEALQVGLELVQNALRSPAAYQYLDGMLIRHSEPARRLAAWQERTKESPNEALGYSMLGATYQDMSDSKDATEAFRRALDLDPMNLETKLRYARALAEEGQIRKALRVAREVIELEPTWVVRACSELRMGGDRLAAGQKWELAFDAYHAALSLKADDAPSWVGLACAQENSGRPERALSTYREAISLNKDEPWLHESVDGFLMRHKDPDARVQFWESQCAENRAAMAWVCLSASKTAKGDTEGALNAAREAVRIDSALFQAQAQVGRVLVEKGESEAAIPVLRTAVELRPYDVEMRVKLTAALVETGDMDAAKAELAECRQRNILLPSEVVERMEGATGPGAAQ